MDAFVSTPFGTMRLRADADGITDASILSRKSVKKTTVTNPILKKAVKELQEYVTGKRTTFTVPVSPTAGTPFQRSVWKSLQKIPYGKTKTYGQIARSVGKPAAVRAVGTAVGKNPLCVIIPCHRVLPSTGKVGNYASGPKVKAWLLKREGVETK